MKKGVFIQSDSGTYKLVLNETGNLEVWCTNDTNEMVWSAHTYDKYIEYLYRGSDRLYLLGKDGSNRLNGVLDKLKQKAYSLEMQNDGNLTIFDENGRIAWKYTPDKKRGMSSFSCFKIISIDSFS